MLHMHVASESLARLRHVRRLYTLARLISPKAMDILMDRPCGLDSFTKKAPVG